MSDSLELPDDDPVVKRLNVDLVVKNGLWMHFSCIYSETKAVDGTVV